MSTAKGRARAKRAWKTRRARYGKDGVMDTAKDKKETAFHVLKGPQRRRPATHFFMGDQIKPLGKSKAWAKQWKKTQRIDVPRDGRVYEIWERVRVKRKGTRQTFDRWANEWAHMNDPAPKGRLKLVKIA